MKRWQHVTITIITSLSVSALAADITEKVTSPELDATRMGIALLTGTVVQALTLALNGKGFERLEKARTSKTMAKARSTNAAEAFLAGVAAAAVIGAARGWFNLELPLSGEFALAAIAGSFGAEAIFKRLEKIAPILKDDDKDKKSGDGS